MKKYICADDYIERNGAYPASTTTTLKQVCDELKAMQPADVIPVKWIENWCRAHYHTDVCQIVNDWKAMNV